MPISINGTGPVGGVTTLTATGVNIENTGASANSLVKYANSGKNWYAGLRGDTSNVWAISDDSAFRMTVDGSGNLGFNSGYGSAATAYGCRAWVNFNGQGTIAIRASGNVSSLTDEGVGNYAVNMTTAMPDTNYNVVVGGSFFPNPQTAQANAFFSGGVNTSTFRIGSNNFSAGKHDPELVYASVFR
jgi:hypothetical protein